MLKVIMALSVLAISAIIVGTITIAFNKRQKLGAIFIIIGCVIL